MSEVRYQDTLVSSRKDHKIANSDDIYHKPTDQSVEERLEADRLALEAIKERQGRIVGANDIRDGAITTPKIADSAVSTSKIADLAVTTGKIASGAVTGDKIAEGSIDTHHIKRGAVVEDSILDQSVTTRKIADGAITKEKIASDSITEEKIAAGAVSTDEIQDGCITKEKLSPDLEIPSAEVIDDKINKAKDAALAAAKDAKENPVLPKADVDTENLRDGSVTTGKIADGAITKEKIASDSITEEKIAAGAVSTDEIQDGCITKEKLSPDLEIPSAEVIDDKINKAKEAALAAAKDAKENPVLPKIVVGTDNINAQSVTTEKLADGSVSQEKLAADSVTEEKIAAGAVSTDEIQDGCVTKEKLSPDVTKYLVSLMKQIAKGNQVVFLSGIDDVSEKASSAGKYGICDGKLYISDNSLSWQQVNASSGRIYVDETTAQSYISSGDGGLVRLDDEGDSTGGSIGFEDLDSKSIGGGIIFDPIDD